MQLSFIILAVDFTVTIAFAINIIILSSNMVSLLEYNFNKIIS